MAVEEIEGYGGKYRWRTRRPGGDFLEQRLGCGHWIRATFDSLVMKDESCPICSGKESSEP